MPTKNNLHREFDGMLLAEGHKLGLYEITVFDDR